MTIQVLCPFIRESATDLIVGEIEWILANHVAFRTALRNHGRSNRGQVEDVAAVQRQLVGLALVDHRAQRGTLSLQQGRGRSDLDDLTHFADLERGIDTRALLHIDRNIGAHEVLKALLFHVDPVLAGEQVHKREEPVRSAGLGALFLCAQVGQGYIRVRNRGSGGVGDCASDRAIGVLAEERERGGNKDADREQQTPEYATGHR